MREGANSKTERLLQKLKDFEKMGSFLQRSQGLKLKGWSMCKGGIFNNGDWLLQRGRVLNQRGKSFCRAGGPI